MVDFIVWLLIFLFGQLGSPATPVQNPNLCQEIQLAEFMSVSGGLDGNYKITLTEIIQGDNPDLCHIVGSFENLDNGDVGEFIFLQWANGFHGASLHLGDGTGMLFRIDERGTLHPYKASINDELVCDEEEDIPCPPTTIAFAQ